MSNEQIYGGPLRAKINKSPNIQEVVVRGDGVNTSATSGNLVKSISMAMNEVYRPEVTLEDRFESVDEHLFERHGELMETEQQLENVIESYEDMFIPDYCADPYRDVLENVREYRKELETAMSVLTKEADHAFGNNENTEV